MQFNVSVANFRIMNKLKNCSKFNDQLILTKLLFLNKQYFIQGTIFNKLKNNYWILSHSIAHHGNYIGVSKLFKCFYLIDKLLSIILRISWIEKSFYCHFCSLIKSFMYNRKSSLGQYLFLIILELIFIYVIFQHLVKLVSEIHSLCKSAHHNFFFRFNLG